MNFEQRQAVWRGEPREFRQHNNRADRPVVWLAHVVGDRVYTSHGLLGGAMQTTDYQGKVRWKGKANEISAEMDAIAWARRDARKKRDFEGYDEYIGGVNVDNRVGVQMTIPALLADLPGSFSLYKPANNLMDCKALLKKVEACHPDILYTLKRDGEAMLIVVDGAGEVTYYSRRATRWNHNEGPTELKDGTLDYSTMVPWGARFEYMTPQIKALNLPPWTMLAGEMCHWRVGENRKHVAGVLKSKTPEALSKMNVIGKLSFYVWDVPFYNGQDLVSTAPAFSRHQTFLAHYSPLRLEHVLPKVIQDFKSTAEAQAYAIKHRYEGWVVMDCTGVYGEHGWNLSGKPRRPSSYLAKLKPEFSDDFVVMFNPEDDVGSWGSGKHERGKLVTLPSGKQVTHGGVGSVGLFQYRADGILQFICKCSGMEYEFQAKLRPEDLAQPTTVWEVKYTDRTFMSDGEDTNALQFPRMVRVRDDKAPNECVEERL